MPISILMPALSPTMTEGNLVKWNKKIGDKVKPGDVLAEIETDKATMEVEAVDEGVLAKIYIPEGSEAVKVNSLIAALLEDGEDETALQGLEAQAKAPTGPASAISSATPEQTPQASVPSNDAGPQNQAATGRIVASPLAKRIAEQHSVDLATLHGSGPHGRIIKQDVLQATHQPSLAAPAPMAPSRAPTLPTITSQDRDIPLSGMRKTIAKRLTESKQQVPHFYLEVECRVDELLKQREMINKSLEKQNIKISVNDMVIKACGVALRRVPEANAQWGGEFIRQLGSCDVSVAVAIEGGLITPIVTQADQRGLVDISLTVKDLVKRAQAGQLKPSEYQGGGFSLSNLGMYGISSFQAIINPPQASILAVGAAVAQPVVVDGQLQVGQVITCSLSVDHRVLDGAVAARFLKEIQTNLENPSYMLV